MKRLALPLGVLLVIGLLRPVWGPRYDEFFSELMSSQRKNLEAVHEHIRAILPQWNDFTNQNAGFELVSLYACTANDGVFGACGFVPSNGHLTRLTSFMESTHPPRPVVLNVRVVDEMPFEDFKILQKAGPGGASNGSRPALPETDGTPSAAGSIR